MLQYYKKTPYFKKYADFFEDTYKRDWHLLAILNEYMLHYFLDVLGIKVRFFKASDHLFEGKKSCQVLDMCKKMQADQFVFGEQGKDYAVLDDFDKQGIGVYFQNYNHPIYRQRWGDYVSHLSVVDLLFNEGAEKAKEIIMSDNISKNELLAMFASQADDNHYRKISNG